MNTTTANRAAKLKILPARTTCQIGYLPVGTVEIDAPVAYVIKSIRLELVRSMITPERRIRRAFTCKMDKLPVGPEKFVCSMPFTSSQVVYHPDGTFGDTSVEWSLEAKAVLVFPGLTPNGGRDPRPQILEGRTLLPVARGEAKPQLTLVPGNDEGNPGYILAAIFCFLLLLSFGWGVKLLVVAGLLYGLFYVERELTRAHLMRGLDVRLEMDEGGRPRFRFGSIAGADDFKQGVVGIMLRERFSKSYYDNEGAKKSRVVRKDILKQFKNLSRAPRHGQDVVCSLPINMIDYPATLDFDEEHGYAWTASYVYPRKYWLDVRVDWDLEVGIEVSGT